MENKTINRHKMPIKAETDKPIAWTDEDIQELQLGLIVDALKTIRNRRHSMPQRQEAVYWLMSDLDPSPLSAVNCCLSIGLDIHYLRSLMNKLTHGGLSYEPKQF